MKITLIVSLIIIATNIHCQTTQEEYNFITKGYRFTIEHGLDMKNNY